MSALSTPPAVPVKPAAPAGPSLARKILGGVSSLGAAAAIERGLSFLANLCAARLGGAATFGSYALALTTANNIASYAGAGIGSTAARFSGQYAHDARGRRMLARALALISISSAVLAAALLSGGARPLAAWLLHNPSLTPLLRWAALPAAATILLECYRGFLLGQQRFRLLICLSVCVGLGYVAVLPLASRSGAVVMVWGFAAVTVAALLAVLAWQISNGRREEPSSGHAAGAKELGGEEPSVARLTRQVWSFGMVQLAGVVGLNAAGFWIASLVVRSDATMVEMGLFAAANQVRNIAGLAPGLFTQTSFGLLADASHDPGRVVGVSSCAAALASVLLAGAGIAVLPWALPLAYGRSFHTAVLAGCLALATSIVHLSNGPAAARLTIVSLRETTLINSVWAGLVFLFGAVFLARGFAAQAAAGAMLIYLVAHVVSASLVAGALGRAGSLPHGMLALLGIPTFGAIVLAALAWAREASRGQMSSALLTAAIALWTGLLAWGIFRAGSRHAWAPSLPSSALARFGRFRGRFGSLLGESSL